MKTFTNTDQYGGPRYLTVAQLRRKLRNRSRSSIYLDFAAGRLPKPIKLGGRLYWIEGKVDDALQQSGLIGAEK